MTLDPGKYAVPSDATVRNIDLDREVFVHRGERLTEERAEALVEEAPEQLPGRGRPSLSSKSQKSPQIGVRLPPDIRLRLERRAESERKSLSQLAREAIEHYD